MPTPVLPQTAQFFRDVQGGIPGEQLRLDPQSSLSREDLTYSTYAGVDIVAEIVVPHNPPMVLGELQTISYSIHRENTPIRFLGHVNVMGFVKGPRTIAGSLIFTTFNTYAFYRIWKLRNMVETVNNQIYPLADMLPPFDVVLTFSNETGSFSKMKIFGVTIVDEGGTMSIDDLVTEQTFTYMARGIAPMIRYLPSGFSAGDVSKMTTNRNTLRFNDGTIQGGF